MRSWLFTPRGAVWYFGIAWLLVGGAFLVLSGCGEMPETKRVREQQADTVKHLDRQRSVEELCTAFNNADPIERERTIWLQKFCGKIEPADIPITRM